LVAFVLSYAAGCAVIAQPLPRVRSNCATR
jgi:hypothetical protein